MHRDMLKHDVIILGGGPAGLSTVLHLHQTLAPRSGPEPVGARRPVAPHHSSRILILEKARYPRPKSCAAGLVLDAEILVQLTDLSS